MHSRNFGRKMHSRNFGLFFVIVVFLLPRIISCVCFVLICAMMEKKKGQEKNRRSVCSLFFKRNERMYVKRYTYPTCFLNWTTTS